MKILVLGINGMIGSAIFKELSNNNDFKVVGTLRKTNFKEYFDHNFQKNILYCEDLQKINLILDQYQPKVIINAIGVTKHKKEIHNIQNTIYINSIFPHNLKDVCRTRSTRLDHKRTDCVFSGKDGQYLDYDNSDAIDFYGKTKALGEINDETAITIRTSTIGHEFNTKFGLLEWFLMQKENCQGFNKALFSGLTNIELSKVIANVIIPNQSLTGIYNCGGNTIDKYSLLKICKEIYKKKINININKDFIINRTLNSSVFYSKTGYVPPEWGVQIEQMYKLNLSGKF